MKKSIILTLLIAVVLSITGCEQAETTVEVVDVIETKKNEVVANEPGENPENEQPAETKEPEQPAETEEPAKAPVTTEGSDYIEKYINSSERPIAVMIDNDNKDARPQSGLDDAYIVYEMPVEGGATRFMALFRGVKTEKIGPVRSSRHYFLDFAKENNAIYTHYGWSPKASSDIPKLGVNNINGITGSDANVFWRERKFKGDWHSAYTSIQKIKERSKKKGYKVETDTQNGIKYSNEQVYLLGENAASEITLPYSKSYQTGYKFNSETKLYEKYINNEQHKMQNDNVLSFKNVIVEYITDKSLGDGSARREIVTTGSGKGYYFTNGACIEITWSKESRTSPTIYKKMDGSELEINAGNTAINIISPSKGVKVK